MKKAVYFLCTMNSSFDKIKNFNYDIVPYALLLLMPLVTITGPFLPDFFLCIIATYFLIKSIKLKLWSYYKNYFVYIFFCFYLYLNIRSLFTADAYLAFSSSLFYFRYLFYTLGLVYILNNFPKSYIYLGLSMMFTITMVSLDGMLQYLSGVNIFGWSSGSPERISGFFRDELIIGKFISHILPIGLSLLIISYKFRYNILSILIFLLIILNSVVVFLSGERGSFFYVCLFFIISSFVYGKKTIIPSLFFFLLSTIVIIFFILNSSTNNFAYTIKDRMFDTTLSQITSNKIPYMPYSPHHEAHYISALKMFKDNIFFGQGPNVFRKLCDQDKYYYENSCSTHPHNFYIQLLAETGLVGFSFLFFPFFFISKKIFYHFISNIYEVRKKWRLKKELILPYVALFTFLWPLIPTMNFYNQIINIYIYMIVGIIIKFSYPNKS